MASRQVNMRVPIELLDEIDRIIKSGDFGDRSEFIKYAIRKTLQNYSGRGQNPPPLVRREGIEAHSSLPTYISPSSTAAMTSIGITDIIA